MGRPPVAARLQSSACGRPSADVCLWPPAGLPQPYRRRWTMSYQTAPPWTEADTPTFSKPKRL